MIPEKWSMFYHSRIVTVLITTWHNTRHTVRML